MAKKKSSPGLRALRITGKVFKWFFIVLGTLLLIGAVTCAFLAIYGANYVNNVILPEVEESNLVLTSFDPDQSSVVYYLNADGEYEELETFYGQENRIWVSYSEMPENLIRATVAIEDKRFWTHSGVDWIRTGKAALNMLTGADVQGGSTITQQLIKNLTQNDDVTVKRKLLEIFQALQLDGDYSKEDILEWYLNNIFLGRRCYGVYTASYKYFGKDVTQLDLAECACLVSITNNPSYYDPYNYPEHVKSRAALVLQQMYKQELITETEEIAALSEIGYLPDGGADSSGYPTYAYNAGADALTFTDGSSQMEEEEEAASTSSEYWSWYVDALYEELVDDLMEEYGYTKSVAQTMLYSGGLTIYSCFDAEVQASVDEVYTDRSNLDYTSSSGEEMQSGITVIDNETGAVVALSGGIGEKTGNRIWNNATQAVRQPGSSIKPLSVYAPALEESVILPSSAVDDSPFMELGGNPWPSNSSDKYSGLTSVYTGVVKSLNTVAVKTLDMVGLETSYSYLEDAFGLTTLVDYMVTSSGSVKSDIDYATLALGGLTKGVTTYEMAGAYSVFARDGVYIEPHMYTQVLDIDGNVILSNDSIGEAVLSSDTVFYINYMLEGVVNESSGTGRRAQISGMTVAGKTGTTTAKRDLWFAGYTPYYTAVVWTGYEKSSDTISSSNNLSVTLWQKVMAKIHENLDDADFPNGGQQIVTATYCTASGLLATGACTEAGCAAKGTFIKGDVPTEYCTLHTTITICLDSPISEDGDHYHIATGYCVNTEEIGVLDYERTGAAALVTIGDESTFLSYYEAAGECPIHGEDWAVGAATQTVTTDSARYTKQVGDSPFNLNARAVDGNGTENENITYQYTNNGVISMTSDGTVTILSAGTATIYVTAAATDYAPEVTITVTVIVTDPSIDGSDIENESGGR